MAFSPTGGAPTADFKNVLSDAALVITEGLPPSANLQDFFVAEISYFRPEAGTIAFEVSTAAAPTGAFGLTPSQNAESAKIYVSDLGYISNPDGPIGQKIFEPILVEGWRVDRTARLEPWSNSGSVSWGAISIINPSGRLTAIVDSATADGRPLTIKRGYKRYDHSRGLFIDPSYTNLSNVFSGVSNGLWRRNQNTVEIDIRDASYQGESPLQRSLYGGTGGYDGSADIKDRPLPFCRGGTNSFPIKNVSPILIDPTNRIWQYNDGPGTIVALYERGAEVFINAGDTTNLYSGSVASGSYRTDNSRGLFQLGATAQGVITADVTGSFPTAGLQSTGANIARYILTETVGIDSGFIDTGSFIGLNADRPYISGVYITDPVDAMSVVDDLLRGLNAWLSPSRSGFLQAVLLRAPNDLAISASYNTNQIINCTARTLPATLTPPPYRMRVGHTRRYTTQTDNWAGATTESQKQFLAEPYSYATWLSTMNLGSYRSLNDPPIIETFLLDEDDAQSLVDDLGNIFGVRRGLYDIELPSYLMTQHEVGEAITFQYPGIADNPVNALIIGDTVDSKSPTFMLRVLV